jgi:DNA-binding transcriptional ArsR family regulator
MAERPDATVGGLEALASGVRLSILRALRTPRTLTAIAVRGERADAGSVLARQSVRRHLDTLLDAGLVTRLDQEGDEQYVVDHLRLFTLAEEVRDLARLRAVVEPDAQTQVVPRAAPSSARGTRLVLVRGLDEGQTFRLDPEAGQVWRIGRRRGLEVCLDYDAAVSGLNAIVRATDAGDVLEDAAGSTNGTWHNFERLPPGKKARLRHGDVIGVGRSLLLYWS